MLGVFQNITTAQTPQKIVGGVWNSGLSDPTLTTRLNYEGHLYATSFFGVGTNLTSLNAGNIGSGTLVVGRGGTGTTSSPSQGGIIYGASTSAYASTSAGAIDQILMSNGSSAPAFEYMGQGLANDSSRIGTTAYSTDLSYLLQANATYMIIFDGAWYRGGGSTSTMTFTVNFDETTNSPRLTGSGFYATSENATTFTNFYLNHSSATDAAAGTGFTTASESTTRTNVRIFFSGYIRTGGSSRTIRVRTRNSNASPPSQVGLVAGSSLVLIRVA
jgi:hypothetical protein